MNPHQRQRAEELERMRRAHMSELEEAFDRRYDGVAAGRRFQQKLDYFVLLFGDGTAGTGRTAILHQLIAAERKVASARALEARR